MRRISAGFLLFICPACESSQQPERSYWEAQQGRFRYRDRTAFVADSTLQREIKRMKPSRHYPLDALFAGSPVYLYSWQTRTDTLLAFIVVEDRSRDEHGAAIYSMLYDRSGRLLSNMLVASKSGEGGIVFETTGRRMGPDTMLLTHAVTDFYDYRKGELGKNGIGDTVFSYLVMAPGRPFSEVIFKKVKNRVEVEH